MAFIGKPKDATSFPTLNKLTDHQNLWRHVVSGSGER
jgi:hypothetical protein